MKLTYTLIGYALCIFQCGQPQTVGRCNECGAAIGGRGYKPESGNKPVTKLVMFINMLAIFLM